MPFDQGQCQIPYPSPGPKGWRFQLTSALYSTNRFHVAVRLFSNRSQMTSKSGKNKKVAHEAIAECVTDQVEYYSDVDHLTMAKNASEQKNISPFSYPRLSSCRFEVFDKHSV